MGILEKEAEIVECAARMTREAIAIAEADREETWEEWIRANGAQYKWGANQLAFIARKLHKAYERACSERETTDDVAEVKRLEGRAIGVCHALGLRVRFNGDPRGAPIQIHASPANANGLGGDAIIVPFLHSSFYKPEDTQRAILARAANQIGALSRRKGAPHLSETSTAEDVAAWLQWCDPNGAHTADSARAEDCDAYTDDRAWEALAEMVNANE